MFAIAFDLVVAETTRNCRRQDGAGTGLETVGNVPNRHR